MGRSKLVMDIEKRKRRDVLNAIERLRTQQMKYGYEKLSIILNSYNINYINTKLSILNFTIMLNNHLESQIKFFEEENLKLTQYITFMQLNN